MFAFPRGKVRSDLGRQGLIGKIRLDSTMSEEEIFAEIRSCFKEPFGGDMEFPFKILQSAGAGAKSLIVPALSSSYEWKAKEVASSGGSRAVYIWAQKKLSIVPGQEAEAFSSDEDDLPPVNMGRNSHPALSARSKRDLVHTPGNTAPPFVNTSPPSGSSASPSVNTFSPDYTPSQRHYREYCELIDLTKETDSSNDEEHDTAEPNSTSVAIPPTEEVQHLLQQHFSRVIREDEYQRINIRRRFLLQDATKQFQRKSFDVSKLLRVEFVGEAAIDTGGPRREFLQLLLVELFSKSGLFEGYPASVTPTHNVLALSIDTYTIAGKMIATSIIQGGPAPRCFAAAVADVLVYNEVKGAVDLSEIHDVDIQEKMTKLQQAKSTEEVHNILQSEDYSFRFDCGFSKPDRAIGLDDIPSFLRAVWLHFTVYRVHGEIQQLRGGLLNTLHFNHLITANPEAVRSLIASGDPFHVSATNMQELLQIEYAPQGSNDRFHEEAVIINYFNLLQDCEDDPEAVGVTLGDILAFITGVREVPPMGFDRPLKVEFFDGVRLPNASTCALCLRLPRQLVEYSEFKEKFVFSVVGAYGFGNV